MMAKRFRKLDPLAAHEGRITTSGPAQADVGILGWGSTEGAAHRGGPRSASTGD